MNLLTALITGHIARLTSEKIKLVTYLMVALVALLAVFGTVLQNNNNIEKSHSADAKDGLQGASPSGLNMGAVKAGLRGTNTSTTKTPIAIKAASLNGALGLATSSEIYGLKNSGAYQMYQRGAIIYSPVTGARVSTGAIRTTWASTGFENGYLGYPVTDEIGGLRNGGAYQMYERGAIIWSPDTGAQVSVGGIRTVWASTGFENGVLGYPTSNEITGLKNGGVYQMYERGVIIWSPASGGYVSTGGIRTLWASTGFENGALGYPTSNEYVTAPGGHVAQNYQGGTIKWSPSGASITYNPVTATPVPPVSSPYPVSNIPAVNYKTIIHLNLRSGPGAEYDVIDSGIAGTIVSGTGKASGIWYEVKLGTFTGWMSSEYLQDVTGVNTIKALQAYADSKLGNATQLECLVTLWDRESNWNYRAINPAFNPTMPNTPSYQAFGIPQAAPGIKMATSGADWQTNPRTQINWGLDYIAQRHGAPCNALDHSYKVGWY